MLVSAAYPSWQRFLNFKQSLECHKDWGGGNLYYNKDFEYPIAHDEESDFHDFIRINVEHHYESIKVTKHLKSWWVDYTPGTYSGLHNHKPGQQLTSVLFLSTAKTSEQFPLAGNLVTLQPLIGDLQYNAHEAIEGNCIIMDGNIWHGTYPSIDNRQVFVSDYEYEVVQ